MLVGLENAGKTELAYKICGTKREEHLQTKGCRVYNANIGILSVPCTVEDELCVKLYKLNSNVYPAGTKVQLTEIGGAPEFRDLWKYYFLDVRFSIQLYCLVIDTSFFSDVWCNIRAGCF